MTTVKQLIEELKNYSPDSLVEFEVNDEDIDTQIVENIKLEHGIVIIELMDYTDRKK